MDLNIREVQALELKSIIAMALDISLSLGPVIILVYC
jgi:hypothetical protein